MSIYFIIGLLVLGLAAGYLSGLLGIGGGIIILPALVFIFGFSQHMAQGTTLGILIPPIGLLAAIQYYQKGFVDVKAVIIICLGFIAGTLLGSNTAMQLPAETLRKIFAFLLIIVGIRMLFFKR